MSEQGANREEEQGVRAMMNGFYGLRPKTYTIILIHHHHSNFFLFILNGYVGNQPPTPFLFSELRSFFPFLFSLYIYLLDPFLITDIMDKFFEPGTVDFSFVWFRSLIDQDGGASCSVGMYYSLSGERNVVKIGLEIQFNF